MSDDLIITMKDVRAAKMCSSGARLFFQRHNLNWKDFLERGICVTELSEIQDAMKDRVIEVARGRIKEADDRL